MKKWIPLFLYLTWPLWIRIRIGRFPGKMLASTHSLRIEFDLLGGVMEETEEEKVRQPQQHLEEVHEMLRIVLGQVEWEVWLERKSKFRQLFLNWNEWNIETLSVRDLLSPLFFSLPPHLHIRSTVRGSVPSNLSRMKPSSNHRCVMHWTCITNLCSTFRNLVIRFFSFWSTFGRYSRSSRCADLTKNIFICRLWISATILPLNLFSHLIILFIILHLMITFSLDNLYSLYS